MKVNESFSIIRKIVFITIILICMLVVGAKASKSDVNYVTIVFPENYETTVMTSSVKISDILSENHIIILPDEVVSPKLDDVIDITKTITISKLRKRASAKVLFLHNNNLPFADAPFLW